MANRLWTSASKCLLVSPIAFVAGGMLLFGAVDEIYGSSDDPRGWLVIACTAGGIAFFALGATTWFRACRLVMQSRAEHRTIS
jgi:hypothetical protein